MNALARTGIALASVSAFALQAGTQFTAWWYGYQPNLGWYVLDLEHGARLYPPWSIVVWALKWWHLQPIRLGAFLSLACVGFVAWCAFKSNALPWQRKKDDVLDAPEWGTEADLLEHGLLTDGCPAGVVLGMLRNKRLVTYRGDEPVLFDGGTGTGKTSGGIIPFILSADTDSALVLDPKGELWDMTARWRSSLGQAGYFDPVDRDSLRINPFSSCRFGTEHEVRDVSNIVRILLSLVRADSATADYYQRRTRPLMVAMALHIANDLDGRVSFGAIRRMVADFEKKVLPGMRGSKCERVRDEAVKFSEYGADTKAGTLQGVSDALEIFDDPFIDRATSDSDIDVNDLMAGDKPMTVYLRSRFSDQDRLRPLMLFMTRYIVSRLMFAERECDDGRPKLRMLSLVMEEIGDARDDWLVSKLIVMRSCLLRPVMAAQSMKLLKERYGTLNTIDENCYAIVSYSTIGQDEQSYHSGNAGQKLEQVERVSRKHGPFFRDHDKTVSTSAHKSPLLTRSDVRGLPADRQMVTVKGCRKAFLLYKPTWYEHPVLKLRGDNVRGGVPRPKQAQWVLDMHRSLPARSNATAPVQRVMPVRNVFKVLQQRTGFSDAEIAEKVFGGTVKATYVEQLIAGTKRSKTKGLAAQVYLDKMEREPVA